MVVNVLFGLYLYGDRQGCTSQKAALACRIGYCLAITLFIHALISRACMWLSSIHEIIKIFHFNPTQIF